MATRSPDLHGLNPASKEYLEAIFELEEEGQRILQARISERLGLARATVSLRTQPGRHLLALLLTAILTFVVGTAVSAPFDIDVGAGHANLPSGHRSGLLGAGGVAVP